MSYIFKTGENPGNGYYQCTNCHTTLSIEEYDKLPPCPSCTNTEYNGVLGTFS